MRSSRVGVATIRGFARIFAKVKTRFASQFSFFWFPQVSVGVRSFLYGSGGGVNSCNSCLQFSSGLDIGVYQRRKT